MSILVADMIFYKFVLAAVIVVVLSFVAEHISPKWAGILSGFPTGTAITLYFFALQNGLEFAGDSAIYNMVGLVAMQMFIFCYYICGLATKRFKVVISVCGGFAGYLITIVLLSYLPVTPILAIGIPVCSFFLFKRLFKKIHHLEITEKLKPTWSLILIRACVAALTICLITGIAKMVGQIWAGLLSAFPTTLFPLLLIIHVSYGERYAHSIIKHVPDGLGALLAYSLVLYVCYPSLGLYSGIAIAFSVALMYLLIYQIIITKKVLFLDQRQRKRDG